MKPRDYIKRFALDTDSPNVEGTLQQLRLDFMTPIEFYAGKGTLNITMFDNITKQIREKFEMLQRVRTSGLNQGMWDWMHDVLVTPKRVESFPEHYAKIAEAEQRRRRIEKMRAKESELLLQHVPEAKVLV